jgi:hypothetical protein
MKSWDFEGYWNVVFGSLTPAEVVRDFDLEQDDRAGLDEWIGNCEAEAWHVGGQSGAVPVEWAAFHKRALLKLNHVALGDEPYEPGGGGALLGADCWDDDKGV